MKKLLVLALVAVGLAACGPTREDRALGGAGVGALAGAAIGGVATGTAGGALAGAAIGGATGAVIGASTAPDHRCVGRDQYGRRVYYRC